MSVVSPTWLSLSGEANYIRSTYIDGFLDVSSSRGVLLRSDVSFGSRLNFPPLVGFTGTVSPNSTAATSSTWANNGITWTSSASSSAAGVSPFFAFNKDTSESSRWLPSGTQNTLYNTSGVYFGSVNTTVSGITNGVTGEWLQIQSSTPVIMKDFAFGTMSVPERSAKTFYIVGSNNNSTWSPILYGSFSTTFALGNTYSGIITIPSGTASSQTMTVNNGTTSVTLTYNTYGNSTSPFAYFRMIATSVYSGNNGYSIDIAEWNINFTPSTQAITLAPSTTAYCQLDLTGGLTTTQNVGIGTTNPSSRLHVHNTDSNFPIRMTNNVGGWLIGQPNNSDTALYVVSVGSGSFVYVTPGATGWAGASDRRLKENIVPLSSALENIMKLNPVKYNFIGNETNTNFGLIAQEVLDIYPEVVSNTSNENYEDGVYGITYTEFIPVLVKGMQEQQSQIDALVARLAAAGIA